ncbi:hypothetical protein MNV_2230002 [Candidatus Methanoperedens nitroreducens]|uniref:Uncharacterized protein n=1 Tax=Candidatus Methanoperedens nitratireducens TaxID=1392998 RepID=A0A284VP75_9EURY|nr:hypothetical protein MNV_2230002 [Candidatus Methanoperedens nitroreducens]
MFREKWSSGIGFNLASIYFAIGIGNLCRFLCITDKNGAAEVYRDYLHSG